MLTIVIALLLGLLPWCFGTVILYSLLYQPRGWHYGHHLVVIGAGSYIGYITFAGLMYHLQANNLPALSITLLIALALACALICWMLGQLGRYRYQLTRQAEISVSLSLSSYQPKWLLLLLGCWLTAQFGFVAFEVALRPTVSWDSVTYWSRPVKVFIEWQQSKPEQGNINFGQRHPSTVILLNSWAAYAAQLNEGRTFLYAPWLALYSGVLCAATGTVWILTGRLLFGLITAILVASSPVVTAHVILSGYADIWIATGLFYSTVILVLRVVTWKPAISITWSFVAGSLTFIKSAGISYTMLLIAVALLAWITDTSRIKWAIATIVLGIGAISYVYLNGIDLSVAGHRLAFDNKIGQLSVGRYVGLLELSAINSARDNLLASLVWNASYQMTTSVFLLTLTYAMWKPTRWREFFAAYALFLVLGLFFYAVAAQVMSDHFLTYSSPDNDSGLTRFSQGWFLVCILVAARFFIANHNPVATSPKTELHLPK